MRSERRPQSVNVERPAPVVALRDAGGVQVAAVGRSFTNDIGRETSP